MKAGNAFPTTLEIVFPVCLSVMHTAIVCSSFKFRYSKIFVQKARSAEHQMMPDQALSPWTYRECSLVHVGRYSLSLSAVFSSLEREGFLFSFVGPFGNLVTTRLSLRKVDPCAITERIQISSGAFPELELVRSRISEDP